MPGYETMYIEKEASQEELIETVGRLLLQLNHCMRQLDSENIKRISTNKTEISGSGRIVLSGKGFDADGEETTVERLIMGNNDNGDFEFIIKDENGEPVISLDTNGFKVLTETVSTLTGIVIEASNIEGSNIEGSNIEGSNIEGSNIEGATGIDITKNITTTGDITGKIVKGNILKFGDYSIQTEGSSTVIGCNEHLMVKQNGMSYKVLTAKDAPYVEIGGVRHYLKW